MSNSFHLSLSMGPHQSYDVNLTRTDRPEQISLRIGGDGYAVIGDETVSSLVKDRLSKLPSNDFKNVESFRAVLLEDRGDVQKIQNVAIENLNTQQLYQINSDLKLSAIPASVVQETSQTVEKIDNFLQTAVDRMNFRGEVAIVRNGELLLSRGYGVANESGGDITDKTIFHLGSLTKQFTAAAIMLLQQQDRLKTTDPIKNHLPEKYANNPKWQNVTIHQLLNHSSGILSYNADEEEVKEYTLDEIIGEIVDKELDFEPGTAWDYSNGGYALLGAIIEHVSQQSYGDFVKKEIFDRLEMSSSGFGGSYSMEKAAVGYEKKEGKGSLEPVTDQATHLSKAHAAGALYSTGSDMLKWNAALDDDTFISSESREVMFGSEGLSADKPIPNTNEHPVVNYGYGFFTGENPSMGKLVMHEGSIPGFTTLILKFPDKNTSIIVLSNAYKFNMREIGDPILDMLGPRKGDGFWMGKEKRLLTKRAQLVAQAYWDKSILKDPEKDHSGLKGFLVFHSKDPTLTEAAFDQAIKEREFDLFLPCFNHLNTTQIFQINDKESLGAIPSPTLRQNERPLTELDLLDIRHYMEDVGFSGVICISDGISAPHTIKSSNIESEKSPFAIHSVGKMFTGVLALRMVEEGIFNKTKLDEKGIELDPSVIETLEKLSPELCSHLQNVSLKQLMLHQGRFGDYTRNFDAAIIDAIESVKPPPKITDPVQLLKYSDKTLVPEKELDEKGAKYSNTGMLLLGLSLQHLYNQDKGTSLPFSDILHLLVAGPDGANLDIFSSTKPENATFNAQDPTAPYYTGGPAGGYWSTAEDLLKFGQWVNKKCEEERFGELAEEYGGEFFPDPDKDKERELFHSGQVVPQGEQSTSSSMLSTFLGNKYTIAVLSNDGYFSCDKLYGTIKDNILSE